MNRDFLKNLGLEKDAIDQIMAENGKDIEAQKAQLDTLTGERDTLKSQLADANTQIESFKGLDIDGVRKAADDYKAKYEAAEAKAKADIEKLQFDHALSGALVSAKARNAKAVSALLDMEKLSMKDGKIEGLESQLEKLKAENDYLFESDTKLPRIVAPTGGSAGSDDDAAVRSIMGLPAK